MHNLTLISTANDLIISIRKSKHIPNPRKWLRFYSPAWLREATLFFGQPLGWNLMFWANSHTFGGRFILFFWNISKRLMCVQARDFSYELIETVSITHTKHRRALCDRTHFLPTVSLETNTGNEHKRLNWHSRGFFAKLCNFLKLLMC